MKKKQKFSLPDSKIILLTSLILIVGVIMLFVSIFLSPSQNQNDTVLETIIVQKEENTKQESSQCIFIEKSIDRQLIIFKT